MNRKEKYDPAPVLGTRATSGDPVRAALKSGDFLAYQDEANRAELRRRKGL